MIREETSEYILCGKIGWTVMDGKNIGWLAGYLPRLFETNSFLQEV